jgi:hypothetical protein
MDRYYQIPPYPDGVSGATVLIRMLDGLGFRFRWSTEGLGDEDYAFRPAPDCMSIEELVGHVWGLVNWVSQSVGLDEFERGNEASITRGSALDTIHALREALNSMSDEDLKEITIREKPFWYIPSPTWAR